MRIILGCVHEINVTYNGNDDHNVYLPDVPTCRTACRNNGTEYFTYSFYGGGGTNLCYCKTSDAGWVERDGRESGKTSCTGESTFFSSILRRKCYSATVGHFKQGFGILPS